MKKILLSLLVCSASVAMALPSEIAANSSLTKTNGAVGAITLNPISTSSCSIVYPSTLSWSDSTPRLKKTSQGLYFYKYSNSATGTDTNYGTVVQTGFQAVTISWPTVSNLLNSYDDSSADRGVYVVFEYSAPSTNNVWTSGEIFSKSGNVNSAFVFAAADGETVKWRIKDVYVYSTKGVKSLASGNIVAQIQVSASCS